MKKCSRVCKKYRDSRLDLAGDSRLQAVRSCTRARHARSWSIMLAGALQDKLEQLAVQLSRNWNSWLNQAARPSCEPALFWKTWLFAFHYHPSINTLFTHERKRASRENFERKTLEKNKIETLQIPQLSSSPLLNPWKAYYQNFFSPYPFLWEGCLVLWEAIKKEPISHWLMLWSSSGIREARKEIGSVQPHWSKKLEGLRYTW